MPTSHVLPRVNSDLLRKLLIALLCLQLPLVLLTPSASADDFDTATASKTNLSNNVLATPEEEFLPVTEAFKVTGEISSAAVSNSTVSSTAAEPQTLKLTWAIAPHYYLFEERFKFNATPSMTLNPRYSEGTLKFDEFLNKNLTVFHDRVTINFILPAKTSAFDLAITAQGCADAGLCYPPFTQTLHVDPSTGSVTTQANAATPANAAPKNAPAQANIPTTLNTAPAEKIWLWQAILLAIFGGVILNLMPCVFPILSIKVMSLVQADSARLRLHGWAYTFGIMLCFVGFAAVLLVARTGGEAIGWGFQLQSPGLITALAYLFFVMGLSMSGLIQFGARWMGAGQSLTQKSGLTGSFFTGILAALVASPCTAPFMGAALGFALTQPAIACLSVFAALGFGMALPLLLLCYSPALAERLPKPGIWMENLKEFLAFPLYLSAIWLLWVLGRQVGTDLMAAVCVGGVAIAFACWLLGRQATTWRLRFNQLLVIGSLATAIYLPWQMLQKNSLTSRWQAYSPQLVQELRQQGRPVFIDLTADWCITCLANERVTLTKASVEAVFDEHNVATLKGDWTNRDPEISQLLEEYGRSGVPLYLWFPANRAGKADILPQLLTPSVVIDAIKNNQ